MGSPFMLRARNLFDPRKLGQMPNQSFEPDFGSTGSIIPSPPNIMTGGMQGPAMNMTSQPQTPDMSYEQEIAQLMSVYQPETQARDRVNSLLSGMPQRPDNISNLRKIGSVLVGMSQGPEAQEKLTFAPYYRQLADWKEQINPAMQAANLERYGNANERQLAYQTAQAQIGARRTKVAEDAETRRRDKAEADIARDKKKNDIAALRNNDSNWEYFEDLSENKAYLVHPRLGRKEIGAATDFTDLEKAQWRRGDIVTREKLKDDDDDVNKASNWTTIYDYKPDGTATAISYNKVTRERVPITVPTTPPSPKPGDTEVTAKPGWPPSQDARSMELRVGEFKNKFPQYAQWVSIDPSTGQPVIRQGRKVAGYQLGPTDQQYQEILRELYPQGQNQPAMGGQFTPPAGAKPGGTWRQMPSGARVYVEP